MVCFKKKDENLYLITNYKVMYSTLTAQDSVERVTNTKKLKLKILLHQFHWNKPKFYLLSRNPYNKLESLFKNKFKQKISTFKEMKKWQNIHKIFFPYLNLDESISSSIIADKLLDVTFSEFIALLPKTFAKDDHLFPQYWAQTILEKFPIPITKKFKVESPEDMKFIAEKFMLNLDIKINSTKSVQEPIFWGRKEISIVNEIYKNDFLALNYQKKVML